MIIFFSVGDGQWKVLRTRFSVEGSQENSRESACSAVKGRSVVSKSLEDLKVSFLIVLFPFSNIHILQFDKEKSMKKVKLKMVFLKPSIWKNINWSY